jgi:hypothetical protein
MSDQEIYDNIDKVLLAELWGYLTNPETDTAMALRDIRLNFGNKVADLLSSAV